MNLTDVSQSALLAHRLKCRRAAANQPLVSTRPSSRPPLEHFPASGVQTSTHAAPQGAFPPPSRRRLGKSAESVWAIWSRVGRVAVPEPLQTDRERLQTWSLALSGEPRHSPCGPLLGRKTSSSDYSSPCFADPKECAEDLCLLPLTLDSRCNGDRSSVAQEAGISPGHRVHAERR
ncbi:hypothetical protein HPB47_006052 [Ixodes persulcatus]|uniref:Uncharacterized protein n=1 Tax=Ixodes persulcatus TaxID=34615 RepID=A0AC60PBH3_IXOPE|nr:hypothetical protein HPB47_006052 [Ixodes persulcatus]